MTEQGNRGLLVVLAIAGLLAWQHAEGRASGAQDAAEAAQSGADDAKTAAEEAQSQADDAVDRLDAHGLN